MTYARQALGVLGEDLVCQELQRRGRAILARRYRTPLGEIDIVASHRGVVTFVEVKARRDRSFGEPQAAVTAQKQQRLVSMASDYLARHRVRNRSLRFDVAAVDMSVTPPLIVIFEDAFRPGW